MVTKVCLLFSFFKKCKVGSNLLVCAFNKLAFFNTWIEGDAQEETTSLSILLVGCNVRVVHDLYIILSVLLCCLKVAKCGEKKELHVRKLLHTHTCPSLSEIAKQQVMAKAMQKSRSSHTFLSAMDTLICILNILTSKDVQFLASFYFYIAFSTCLFCLLIICPIFL